MQLRFIPIQVAAFLFLPAIIFGNADGNSSILGQKHGRELKREYFLCEASNSTALCLKTKQLCDVSTGRARCICEYGWKGSRCEELIDEPLSILPTRMPTVPRVGGTCVKSSDCAEANSICLEGLCRCDSGFIHRKGRCINKNECEDSSNGCDKNSECIDTQGSYQCYCKDGFLDANLNLPGRICRQTNECNLGMHNCDEATQVCVDRRPPEKWECVEKTPAPTPKPTPLPTTPPTLTLKTITCNQGLKGVNVVREDQCLCKEVVPTAVSYSAVCYLEKGYTFFLTGKVSCIDKGNKCV